MSDANGTNDMAELLRLLDVQQGRLALMESAVRALCLACNNMHAAVEQMQRQIEPPPPPMPWEERGWSPPIL